MSAQSTTPPAASTPSADSRPTSRRLAGKYMTFKLGGEEYGIEILKVRELIGLMPVTRIPGSPPFISGVINLRGRVIPILELRLKFGMPRVQATDQAVIIVIEFRHDDATFMMGVLVDEVVEVLEITADQIEPPPDFGVPSEADDFTLALGNVDGRVICLLDIGKVLNVRDRDTLADVSQPK